jgi:general secretion pathway protein A
MDPLKEPTEPITELIDEPQRKSKERFDEKSSLPLKHFKLSTHPFADSVNPQYFYRTEAHEEAFIAMKQCIEDNVSLGLTTAVSGTGKTLLTQVLIQELDPRQYQTILVLAYPAMSRTALLREIVTELKIENGEKLKGTHQLVGAIQQHIIKQFLRGVRLVLIIDEVHFLNADALHVLRTLSNIEVPDQKLVTVLLFGEKSFLEKLKKPIFRSIFSRMFSRTEIRPLRASEVEQYVKFRMLVAGGRPGIFSPAAIEPLFRHSGGIPREINRICHNALGIAAREGKDHVDPEMIRRIAPALDPAEG